MLIGKVQEKAVHAHGVSVNACREHFHGEQVFNACYSHAWDPTSTRLMCVGGPLAYGLRGCYMALWD